MNIVEIKRKNMHRQFSNINKTPARLLLSTFVDFNLNIEHHHVN